MAKKPAYPSEILLSALPQTIIVVDRDLNILQASGAAQANLHMSESAILGRPLAMVVGEGNPLLGLIKLAHENMNVVVEHDLKLGLQGDALSVVDAQVIPLSEVEGHMLISLQSRSIPAFVESQDEMKSAALSVSGLAAMLAHEIKNPLSGIRGAAQLLERRVSETDKELPKLIRVEVDRIRGLVDDLETFTEPKPVAAEPVNIHQVLDHVRGIAEAGFAQHVTFSEDYDPSLPLVAGNADRLTQVLLNLVKNSAEAIGEMSGGIVLSTSYKHGVWVGSEGANRVRVPLEITVRDTGGGIENELLGHLFDPFVTGHEGGTGLGLALVARFVADMGGTVECDNIDGGAIFRIRLPAWEGEEK